MIAFDFEYYKPSSMAEAMETFTYFVRKGKLLCSFLAVRNSLLLRGRIN